MIHSKLNAVYNTLVPKCILAPVHVRFITSKLGGTSLVIVYSYAKDFFDAMHLLHAKDFFDAMHLLLQQ